MQDHSKRILGQVTAVADLFAVTGLLGLSMAGRFLDCFFELAFWVF